MAPKTAKTAMMNKVPDQLKEGSVDARRMKPRMAAPSVAPSARPSAKPAPQRTRRPRPEVAVAVVDAVAVVVAVVAGVAGRALSVAAGLTLRTGSTGGVRIGVRVLVGVVTVGSLR